MTLTLLQGVQCVIALEDCLEIAAGPECSVLIADHSRLLEACDTAAAIAVKVACIIHRNSVPGSPTDKG